MEEGAVSQGMRVPPEGGEGLETGSPLETPEGMQAGNTLILAPLLHSLNFSPPEL